MLDKLQAIHLRFIELEKQINDPDVMQDMKRYIKLNKDYKEFHP